MNVRPPGAKSTTPSRSRFQTLGTPKREQKTYMEMIFWVNHELKIGGGPRVRFRPSAGGLHQQINKDESRRMTRRLGVDIAKAAGNANECAQRNAFGGRRSNGCAIWARGRQPKRWKVKGRTYYEDCSALCAVQDRMCSAWRGRRGRVWERGDFGWETLESKVGPIAKKAQAT